MNEFRVSLYDVSVKKRIDGGRIDVEWYRDGSYMRKSESSDGRVSIQKTIAAMRYEVADLLYASPAEVIDLCELLENAGQS